MGKELLLMAIQLPLSSCSKCTFTKPHKRQTMEILLKIRKKPRQLGNRGKPYTMTMSLFNDKLYRLPFLYGIKNRKKPEKKPTTNMSTFSPLNWWNVL